MVWQLLLGTFRYKHKCFFAIQKIQLHRRKMELLGQIDFHENPCLAKKQKAH